LESIEERRSRAGTGDGQHSERGEHGERRNRADTDVGQHRRWAPLRHKGIEERSGH